MKQSSFSLPTVIRLAWRHALRRPLQSLFFVVGVAIGVAMIVAIDLANNSAERAFALGTETVTGRATHQIVGGPSGLDESVYSQLRRELGYRQSAPVVEDYVTAIELDEQPMRLLGIDPFAEAPFRSYLGTGGQIDTTRDYLGDMLTVPDSVLISTDVAQRYGLATGDQLVVRVDDNLRSLTVIGLLEPTDDLSRRALESLLIADIATAQEVLDRVGRVDRIDLIVADSETGQADLARIAASLPPDARVAVSAGRAGTVNEMTDAFRLNLTALSLLALVVGVFLIYNTVTFSVIQRRPVLGSLRALGMTRREIFTTILVEAGMHGAVGTLAGLALGIFLGRGAVQMVTQTMNDLFFVVAVREVQIAPATLIKGGIIGMAAALVGAAIPAWEATSVPPAGALRRSDIEERTRKILPWVSAGAVGMLFLGALLLIPDWNLVIAFGGLFAVIIGIALLTPVATLGLMGGFQRLTRGRAGVIERMAPRSIVRSLSRTSVAIAALMVAVSVIIGVGVMVSSFRNTVVHWLDDILQADIYISPPSTNSNQIRSAFDPELAESVALLPGVKRVATTRSVDVVAFTENFPGQAGGGELLEVVDETIPVRLVSFSEDLAGDDRRYHQSVGDWAQTWNALEAGGIIINEPMSNRYGLNVGDNLWLQTDSGRQSFPIVGVAVDFDVNAAAFLHDPVYRSMWDDDKLSAIGLFVEEGVDIDAQVATIRSTFAGDAELLVRSNRGTRENALEVFDRTFAITIALQVLATLVAFIGILSTLMSLQLERSREIGVLRSTGMTRRQLWKLSLLETGLIGSVAGLLAMPTGLILAIILIYIINLRSFGWTLEMQLDPSEFTQAFLVALVAALLAGLYPAWRMGKTQPAEALRSE